MRVERIVSQLNDDKQLLLLKLYPLTDLVTVTLQQGFMQCFMFRFRFSKVLTVQIWHKNWDVRNYLDFKQKDIFWRRHIQLCNGSLWTYWQKDTISNEKS